MQCWTPFQKLFSIRILLFPARLFRQERCRIVPSFPHSLLDKKNALPVMRVGCNLFGVDPNVRSAVTNGQINRELKRLAI